MSRSVPEWIGKTDDTPIPPRVRLRVFEAHNGRCYLTGWKIGSSDKWQIDHVVALANGGENRESNLAPVLAEPHKEKTRADVAQKAKDRRVRQKHLGIHKPKRPMPGSKGSGWRKKMNGDAVRVDE